MDKFAISSLLILCLLVCGCVTSSSAQVGHGKVFVSPGLEYLEIISDSVLRCSFDNDNNEAAYLRKEDTLFIRYMVLQTRSGKTDYFVEWHSYPILTRNEDTIFLLNRYRYYEKPAEWEDTLKLISLGKLKEPIESFRSIRLTYANPFGSTDYIVIDSNAKVIFQTSQTKIPTNERNITTITGVLSKKEFSNFLNTLSCSLPGRLYKYRGGCRALDAGELIIEICYNNKTKFSRGCTIKRVHAPIINYLYKLDANKGLTRQKD